MLAIKQARGRNMKMMTGLGILAGLALCGGSADATTTQLTFGVTMAITAECVINSTATLDLGSSGVINSTHTTNSPLHIQCTNTTPYTIGLDAGTTTGATVSQRLLANGAATINYNIYSDSGFTTVWGNSGGALVGSTGTGADQTFPVYGKVTAQTTPAPGTYTDTVTVTVTY
jgi:spore coat protein U domain-containing protein, fimbrial subunit CupE1/2/3/6